jgi:hypothetical protein
MSDLPSNYEDKIGSPQVIARFVILDGAQVLLRLQKPFEEREYDTPAKVVVRVRNGKAMTVPDETHIKYGTVLVVETWSDATKSVVTTGINKRPDQTEENFAFGVRYMLNNSTDEEIIKVLRLKGIDKQLKFQQGPIEPNILPSPPKEQKKPT